MRVLIFAIAWVSAGIITAFAMYRRGHDFRPWLAVGIALGPLTIPLAMHDARAERAAEPVAISKGRTRRGSIDVLVGIDGSRDALEALGTTAAMLGSRIGRLTLAAVVDYDTALSDEEWDPEIEARAHLEEAAASVEGQEPETVLLAGQPAAALARFAEEQEFDLLAVGCRGRGLTKALLGSVSAKLTHGSGIPVILGPRAGAPRLQRTPTQDRPAAAGGDA